MNIIFVLIPLGLAMLSLAIAFFFWAVRSGQYDDLETPGTLVLFDGEPPVRPAVPATTELRRQGPAAATAAAPAVLRGGAR
jgi:cbb3-type cytochrome oxidase maturation protein